MIVIALISYFIFQSNFQSVNAPIEAPGKSIAVLAFENLSGDKEQEYFSDGIADEILNALAQIKDLKVAGRTSSFWFKGKAVTIQEVGEKLKVSTVLEGSGAPTGGPCEDFSQAPQCGRWLSTLVRTI